MKTRLDTARVELVHCDPPDKPIDEHYEWLNCEVIYGGLRYGWTRGIYGYDVYERDRKVDYFTYSLILNEKRNSAWLSASIAAKKLNTSLLTVIDWDMVVYK